MTADSFVAAQPSRIAPAAVMLSRSTEALLRATDEATLLADICRIAVEAGGFGLAWVGYVRTKPGATVVPMAAAGPAAALVE